MKIAQIGLGHIGLSMAACFANAGYKVIGIDKNPQLIKKIQNNESFNEPGLNELLESCGNNLVVTSDSQKVRSADVVFLLVPSPSDARGFFRSDMVISAIKDIKASLRSRQCVVCVVSTLMPGTMDKEIAPLFEKYSGVKLYYSPVFVALGNVINGFTRPDAIVIGCKDYPEELIEIFSKVCRKSTEMRFMSYTNAELSKLLLNCFITTKISISNACAQICEKFPGGDVDKVMDFLGLDSRIGIKYTQAGMGYGGTCFPRDSKALIAMSEKLNLDAFVQEGTDKMNDAHLEHIADKILRLLASRNIVSVLGLAYKPDTGIVEDSNSIKLIQILLDNGVAVKTYDPLAIPEAKKVLQHEDLVYCDNLADCIRDTDLCVITVSDKEYHQMPKEIFKTMRIPRVYDIWRIYDKKMIQSNGIEYHAVGISDR